MSAPKLVIPQGTWKVQAGKLVEVGGAGQMISAARPGSARASAITSLVFLVFVMGALLGQTFANSTTFAVVLLVVAVVNIATQPFRRARNLP